MAWLLGIILAVIMVRRGGVRAEKLFLTGCSLMFAVDLIRPFIQGLMRWWMSGQDMSRLSTAQAMVLVSLPMAILSLGGLVCLVLAYWFRFRFRSQESA